LATPFNFLDRASGAYPARRVLGAGDGLLASGDIRDGVPYAKEVGKLAQRIIPELESKAEPKLGHDNSTNNLIRRCRKFKETAR
jgi:hypothetical protein